MVRKKTLGAEYESSHVVTSSTAFNNSIRFSNESQQRSLKILHINGENNFNPLFGIKNSSLTNVKVCRREIALNRPLIRHISASIKTEIKPLKIPLKDIISRNESG